MIIRELRVTPIAFSDPPLLNADGVHQPHALRAVVELIVDDGHGGEVTGLGECAGHAWQLDWLTLAGTHMAGIHVFDTAAVGRVVGALLAGRADGVDYGPDAQWRRWADRTSPPESRGPAPIPAPAVDVRRVYAAIEVACLDAQGKLSGVPVVDLLGGRVRDAVPYSAYLFYKWEQHPEREGAPAIGDEWGAALDPDGIVAQARRMVDRYGFRSLKLKGGVFPPDEEIAAIHALRAAFPGHPLRIDPNTAWTLQTSLTAARELEGVLEYLEDPVAGVEDMGALATQTSIPLATNMCVTSLETMRPALDHGAVRIVLADHHLWGGLRGTAALGDVCKAVGWGLSMHSNSHLGISLAAMTHVAAATEHLDHACDTHYPWNAEDDVVAPGALSFVDGAVPVPQGPGLGVELDRAALDRLHATYLSLGREHRHDTIYMRTVEPDFDPTLPRW
ncbi:enolase C-terminal domain-like protein [Streptomyces sp. NPDC059850]|uniref:enolase C-terminal domain-like protein n=1 Tax=Streptomyces sp. NPDC059850 TaxID=3346970 RepID=UPI003664D0B7